MNFFKVKNFCIFRNRFEKKREDGGNKQIARVVFVLGLILEMLAFMLKKRLTVLLINQ